MSRIAIKYMKHVLGVLRLKLFLKNPRWILTRETPLDPAKLPPNSPFQTHWKAILITNLISILRKTNLISTKISNIKTDKGATRRWFSPLWKITDFEVFVSVNRSESFSRPKWKFVIKSFITTNWNVKNRGISLIRR